MDNMEQLTCEIRYSQDDTRQTPGRVTGTLIVYETRAGDRPELFERDAIHWPELGIVIKRDAPARSAGAQSRPIFGRRRTAD